MTKSKQCGLSGCDNTSTGGYCTSHKGTGRRRGTSMHGGGSPDCPGNLRRATAEAAYDGARYRCQKYRTDCTYAHVNPNMLDVDAKDPALGHVAGNLWLICPTCHREKSRAEGDYTRSVREVCWAVLACFGIRRQ